jgi:hypothetical protein
MEYKDTGCECWDYTLNKAGDDIVYIGKDGFYAKEVVHNEWRYVDVSEEPTDELNVPIQVAHLMSDYRFWNWNGRKVSLIGCLGTLCVTPFDAPSGTPTPDLRGFVYQVTKFDPEGSRSPYAPHPKCGNIPLLFSKIGSVAYMVTKHMGNEESQSLFINPYHCIVCTPLAKMILLEENVFLDGKHFNLRAISKLSPHSTPDPEEFLINKLSLDNTVD